MDACEYQGRSKERPKIQGLRSKTKGARPKAAINMNSRIEIFKQMLVSDPINTSILFGLAKEFEKVGADSDLIETFNRYIELSDDEGNSFGMLARAYERTGQHEKAKDAYQRGITAALAHGHPGMADEYRMILSSDYED